MFSLVVFVVFCALSFWLLLLIYLFHCPFFFLLCFLFVYFSLSCSCVLVIILILLLIIFSSCCLHLITYVIIINIVIIVPYSPSFRLSCLIVLAVVFLFVFFLRFLIFAFFPLPARTWQKQWTWQIFHFVYPWFICRHCLSKTISSAWLCQQNMLVAFYSNMISCNRQKIICFLIYYYFVLFGWEPFCGPSAWIFCVSAFTLFRSVRSRKCKGKADKRRKRQGQLSFGCACQSWPSRIGE